MAGHALLPGCQVPWRHDDCPAFESSPPGPVEFRTGGVVCHCPCHGLKAHAARLEAALIMLSREDDEMATCVEEMCERAGLRPGWEG